MSNDGINQISISIKDMLSDLSNSTIDQCIFKVHGRLRNQNKKAYEPQILSIGPYHHGKRHLEEMETNKLRYLQELLHRKQEENADKYISALMKLKDRARRCYAEKISLSENDFVKMLCLDGIFIIEFLWKRRFTQLRSSGDKIFEMTWFLTTIVGDLMLFENQIPFFVLTTLFDMTKDARPEDNFIIELILPFKHNLPFDIDHDKVNTSISTDEVNHLLHLLHKYWCSSFATIANENNAGENDSSRNCTKPAGELRRSGIKFERAEHHLSWLHITFENERIKIPPLIVDDSTESIFRNLIAYEQYMIDAESWKFVTDYATILDNLIDSPRDVEKLRDCQIITNDLGDDEVVATMFNKLVRNVIVNNEKFCYSRVYKEVNESASNRWNVWKAHLWKNYFNTPWSIISILAGVVLLILTVVSTIFSILAVTEGK